jgi:O-acetyl-ADP-ribose deacetylase (regulator of RNase III)
MILSQILIRIVKGDLALIEADAIVNAANKSLLGGGGVDGTIHFAAGPRLLEECKLLGGCQPGEAKITGGYNIPAKYIIHTVGPVYGHEDGNEDELLATCYSNSLLIAKDNGIKTIAFPCISTGAFRFPKDEAAKIATDTVKKFITAYPNVFEEIIFVTYEELDFNIYNQLLKNKL